MTYEYKVVAFAPEEDLERVLNVNGRKGWRLCAMTPAMIFCRSAEIEEFTVKRAEPRPGPAPRLLRTNEAARFLGVSRTRLYELMRAQQLKIVRNGRTLRFAIDDLEAFIDAHKEDWSWRH